MRTLKIWAKPKKKSRKKSSKIASMSATQKLALASGVLGMVFCLLALVLGVFIDNNLSAWLRVAMTGFENASGLAFFAKPLGHATKIMMLEVGAVLLLYSALARGKDGRLYQVLEVSLVLQGLLYFAPLSEEIKFYGRIAVSAGIFGTLWQLGLLSGVLSKMGAAGLEFLGFGYLFNEPACFAIGGVLLTVASTVSYRKHHHWLDLLWLCLNAPFAAVATLEWLMRLHTAVGTRELSNLLIASAVTAIAAVVLYIGFRVSWVDLEGPNKPKPEETHRADLEWVWDEKELNWVEVGPCGTRYIPYEFCTEADIQMRECIRLRDRIAAGLASEKEMTEFEKLQAYCLPIQAKVRKRRAELVLIKPKARLRNRERADRVDEIMRRRARRVSLRRRTSTSAASKSTPRSVAKPKAGRTTATKRKVVARATVKPKPSTSTATPKAKSPTTKRSKSVSLSPTEERRRIERLLR